MSVFATILFSVCWLFMASGFLFYKRNDETAPAITWVGVTILMSMCYHTFMAGILCLAHVPLNLYVFAVTDLLAGGLLWYLNRKRGGFQKYDINAYDIIVSVLLIISVAWFAQIRYDGTALNWNYKAVDPAAHMREAMEYFNWHEVSRMFFAQLNNGMFIQFFAPWFKYDYFYRLYVLADLANLLLSGVLFYGVVRRYCKGHFTYIAAIISTFFYLYGYPVNSTLYGFTYLQMGINVVAMIIVLNDMFVEDEAPKWYSIILLMLSAHAIFQCYALFMPITFLAMGFCLLGKQIRGKKLFSLDTLIQGLSIFLLPIILGFVYTYMDVFVNDNVEMGDAIAAEGGIYRDLYSNFYVFLPIAVVGFFMLVRKKKNRLMTWLAPFAAIFAFGMFYAGYHSGKVSTYYFFKNYYLFWLILFVLIMYAIKGFTTDARRLVVSYMGMWLFVALMFMTGAETKIQEKNNWYVLDHKSQHMNDLLCFNYNTALSAPYSGEKMDLMHYVYTDLLDAGATEKQVPVVSSEEETYIYESVTGQWLTDYKFWRTREDGLNRYFENIDSKVDYICVFRDSGLYALQARYFESFDKVYQNSAGFIARVNPGTFDELMAPDGPEAANE